MGDVTCTKAGPFTKRMENRAGKEDPTPGVQLDPASAHQRPPECPVDLQPESAEALTPISLTFVGSVDWKLKPSFL
ncbi:hypothetical protein DV515_00011527 [Chloebia gouldiae]|uniref:Uncharacterized protein n=1 Tax=Chloebia gouldiae TaxID=44316 RepID=A0A3L8S6C0_CHLGU|nr:hypothetical protein DV515_00011527 [Chloebia gouldiae]